MGEHVSIQWRISKPHIGTDAEKRPDPIRIRHARLQLQTNKVYLAANFIVIVKHQDTTDHLVAIIMSGTSIAPLIIVPLHLFAYSTLLGVELYQSFVMTKVAYLALPRSAFRSLQKRVFPIYFQSQTVLLGVAVLTVPPYGPASLISSRGNWIPLAIAGSTAAINLLVYGPRTQKLMIERSHQGAFGALCADSSNKQ